MVKLNRIYTKTGDDGTTGLVSGERRFKHDLRIEAVGCADEVNACIGWARVSLQADEALDAMLARVQNDLFDLGADLATPETNSPPAYEALRIVPAQVIRLEQEIDQLNAALSPLNSFILPGGSEAAARLHIARTVCRRAERATVALSKKAGEKISPAAGMYLNRLSDLLFVAARHCNNKGASDILWTPGQNR